MAGLSGVYCTNLYSVAIEETMKFDGSVEKLLKIFAFVAFSKNAIFISDRNMFPSRVEFPFGLKAFLIL